MYVSYVPMHSTPIYVILYYKYFSFHNINVWWFAVLREFIYVGIVYCNCWLHSLYRCSRPNHLSLQRFLLRFTCMQAFSFFFSQIVSERFFVYIFYSHRKLLSSYPHTHTHSLVDSTLEFDFCASDGNVDIYRKLANT